MDSRRFIAPHPSIAPLIWHDHTAPRQCGIDPNQVRPKSANGKGGGSANLLQIETVLDSLGMLRRSARKITVKNCTDCANKQTSLGQDL